MKTYRSSKIKINSCVLVAGERFGKLTVVEYCRERRAYKCLCDCGNFTYARPDNLISGRHSACFCGQHAPRLGQRLPNEQGCINEIYKGYRERCPKRGYEFELTKEEFSAMILQNCHYCGIPPDTHRKCKNGRVFVYNGIDRIDNNVGYKKGNIVTACKVCNYAKNTLSLEEWKAWIVRIYSNVFIKKKDTLDIYNDYVI